MTQQQLQDLVVDVLGPLADAANKLVSRSERSQHDETLFANLKAKVLAARADALAPLAAQPARTGEMSNSDTRLDPAATDWATLVAS